MTSSELTAVFERQQRFFASGATRSYDFRLSQLRALERMIDENETELCGALQRDLRKSAIESYSSEISYLLAEIRHARKHLRRWMRPRRVRTLLMHAPAASRIIKEPYGIVAILGPWNYPFQLVLSPLIGAIAAGNCAIIKPSEIAGHSSVLLARLIAAYFDPSYITILQGEAVAAQLLLALPVNHIFFTGSERVGRLVMKAAAEQLIPCTLELGGKNPCIVDKDTDIRITARRIAFGKFFNAGQTCIAPDYLLVHEDIKARLMGELTRVLSEFYGADASLSPDYGRIVNRHHFERISSLLDGTQIICGGQSDVASLYIAPTLVDEVSWDHPIMQDEVFGPVLPVLSYRSLDEAIERMRQRSAPLALYCFSRSKGVVDAVIRRVPSGTVCVNGTMSQVASFTLPFGGIGASGMGKYHGEQSFSTFTHHRSVLGRRLRFDNGKMYPPYEISTALFKRVLRLFFRQY